MSWWDGEVSRAANEHEEQPVCKRVLSFCMFQTTIALSQPIPGWAVSSAHLSVYLFVFTLPKRCCVA